MTMFPEDHKSNFLIPVIIDTIKSNLQIEEVVKEYALLFDSGNELIGKCPFMGCEGSIAVNKTDFYFYCDCCERRGDVLTFIMELENLTLKETIKVILSRYAGL